MTTHLLCNLRLVIGFVDYINITLWIPMDTYGAKKRDKEAFFDPCYSYCAYNIIYITRIM